MAGRNVPEHDCPGANDGTRADRNVSENDSPCAYITAIKHDRIGSACMPSPNSHSLMQFYVFADPHGGIDDCAVTVE